MFVTDTDRTERLIPSPRLVVSAMPMLQPTPTGAGQETVLKETRDLWPNPNITMKKTLGLTTSTGGKTNMENGMLDKSGTKKDNLKAKLEISPRVKGMSLDTLTKMKELELLVKELREP